jgi:hypothetical protein
MVGLKQSTKLETRLLMVQLSEKSKKQIGKFYQKRTRKETLTLSVFVVPRLRRYSEVTERSTFVSKLEFIQIPITIFIHICFPKDFLLPKGPPKGFSPPKGSSQRVLPKDFLLPNGPPKGPKGFSQRSQRIFPKVPKDFPKGPKGFSQRSQRISPKGFLPKNFSQRISPKGFLQRSQRIFSSQRVLPKVPNDES